MRQFFFQKSGRPIVHIRGPKKSKIKNLVQSFKFARKSKSRIFFANFEFFENWDFFANLDIFANLECFANLDCFVKFGISWTILICEINLNYGSWRTKETNVPRRRRRKWSIPKPSMRKAKNTYLKGVGGFELMLVT